MATSCSADAWRWWQNGKKLNGIGIFTIGELAKAETAILQNLLGITGVRLKERANGIDPRPVDPEAGEKWKSIGNSTTLSRNVTEERVLLEVLRDLAQSVSKRMKQKHVVSSTIQIMIRYSNFQTITRSKTWENPVQEAEEIFQRAVYLLKRHWNGNPVRLLGITAIDVFDKREAVKQLDLFHFEEDAKKEALQNTIEHLQQKFGDSIIQKGYEFFGDKHSDPKWRSDLSLSKEKIRFRKCGCCLFNNNDNIDAYISTKRGRYETNISYSVLLRMSRSQNR